MRYSLPLMYLLFVQQVCATVGTQHWIYNVTESAPTALYQTWTYTDTAYGEQLGEINLVNLLAWIHMWY